MPDGDLPPNPSDPKSPEAEIADVDLLFQESGTSAKQPQDSGLLTPTESPGVFDLAEPLRTRQAPPISPASMPTAETPVQPPRAPIQPSGPSPRSVQEARDRLVETARDREFKAASNSAFSPPPDVDQVWSRKDEWGPSLIALASWTIILLGMIYVALASEFFNVAFVVWILGGLYWVYLCYPILITLEIPVRLTPESAVKDYYGALSHHMPHYRRMWLLLSRQGKITPHFGSFEGFRTYWKAQVTELKQRGNAGSWTPLLFHVESFISEKNPDKTLVNARFVIQVFVRGRRDEGPIATIPMQLDLVRGPDKMLYLTDGTLPLPSSETGT